MNAAVWSHPRAERSYSGAFAGPTLRTTEGDRICIVVRNELPETTTVHWPGVKLPAQYDVGPTSPSPGEEWIAEWEVEQPATTCWYHPHTHSTAEAQVGRRLMGLFLFNAEFGRSSDPDWPYMCHCHWLMHHDMGTIGQFVVINDAQESPTVISIPPCARPTSQCVLHTHRHRILPMRRRLARDNLTRRAAGHQTP